MFLCIICIYDLEEGKARAVETYGSLDKLTDVFHGGQVLLTYSVSRNSGVRLSTRAILTKQSSVGTHSSLDSTYSIFNRYQCRIYTCVRYQ